MEMKKEKVLAAIMALSLIAVGIAVAGEATYISGGNTIDYTPTANVAAGDVVVRSDLVGVASTAIKSNELGSLDLEGVFDIVQAAEIITVGHPVYWDADGSNVGSTVGNSGAITETVSGNTFAGFALETTAATDTRVKVQLKSVDSSNAGYALATNLNARLIFETNRAAVAEAAAIVTATNAAISFFVTPGATVTQALPGITNVYSEKGVLISHSP